MANMELKQLARFGGILYLAIIAISIFGELVVRSPLINPDDTQVTIDNIKTSLGMWKIALALDYLLIACGLALAYVYFSLFRRASKNIIILFLFFNLTAFGLEAAAKINLLSVQLLIEQSVGSATLQANQLHTQVRHALDLYAYSFNIGMMFFGFGCLVLGSLIGRSQLLPKLLGRMIQIAGVCYVANTFIHVLNSDLYTIVSPALLLPAFIAEISLCVWLIIFGVKIRDTNSLIDDATEASLAKSS